jgi:3-hydroxyacyl-CoA dehydrogenase / enoyl-CoA hydratase / 3-hydroxybutyryl-CoA epimerase
MQPSGDEALAAAGRLGRKTAKGFYDYRDGKRGDPSPEAYEALGVAPPKMSLLPPPEIESRLVFAMINEAAYCMADEIVDTAAKLDLAMIFGTGFPPFRGGLLRYADSLGAARVVPMLEALATRVSMRYRPAPLLPEMAKTGARFHADLPASPE